MSLPTLRQIAERSLRVGPRRHRLTTLIAAATLHLVVAAPAMGQDCNGNGRDDAEDIELRLSDDCNASGIPDECESSLLHLQTGLAILPLSQVPRQIVSADFDGDEAVDLLAASQGTSATGSKVFVSYNDGLGSFTTPSVIDANFGLEHVDAGDLNGDGLTDFIAIYPDTLRVYLNAGERNKFERGATLALQDAPGTPALDDVDDDGAPDLLVPLEGASELLVALNTGDGDFRLEGRVAVGASPVAATTADFNGDGRNDVLVARVGGYSLLPRRSDGTFAEPVESSVPGRPTEVVTGDYDQDGNLDAALLTNEAIVLLLGRNGTLTVDATYPTAGASLISADFDADGSVDLAVSAARPPSVLLWLGDGDGGFAPPRRFGTNRLANGLAASDFDADGDVDFAFVSPSPASMGMLWSSDRPGAFAFSSDRIELPGCFIGRGCAPHSGAVVDLDGDGRLDIVGANTVPGSFSVALNTPTGFRVLEAQPFDSEQPIALAAADIDADGIPDCVTVDHRNESIVANLGRGNGTFSPSVIHRVGAAPIDVKLGDFNGDGNLDAASANLNSGDVSVLLASPTLVEQVERMDYRVGPSPRFLAVGDYNGDEAVDLAVAVSEAQNVTILLNQRGGFFAPGGTHPLRGRADAVVAADLNQDGHLDLVAASTAASSLSLLRGGGDGTFNLENELGLGQAPYSVTVVDLDGDGALDLVSANEIQSTVSMLRGFGDGRFSTPLHFPAGAGLRFVLPGDVDDDGDIDLVSPDRLGKSFTILRNESIVVDVMPYRHTLCTLVDFRSLSAPVDSDERSGRFLKFTVPARDDSELLSTVFQDTERFPLHQDFLAQVFPERFPALGVEEYDRLVGRRATRDYFVGSITRFTRDGETTFGFNVFADFSSIEALTLEEMTAIFTRLSDAFELEPLVYAPTNAAAIAVARQWTSAPFPIDFEHQIETGRFEAYTTGATFGRVRRLDAESFAALNENGRFSFQDILVLEEAPRDIEGVVGGVITQEPQTELSHLAVRTARRGTPNAFVEAASARFIEFEGELVRLDVTLSGFTVEIATFQEADAFWQASRPRLSLEPNVDFTFGDLPDLLAIAADDILEGPNASESRFGGKASHFSRLQSILSGQYSRYRAPGFSVPLRYYVEFMRTNLMPSALDPNRTVTYESYLDELFNSALFQSDPGFRFRALEAFRDHANEQGIVDPDLVGRLATRIGEVFGTTSDRIRIRSSSNVEDALEFNGAGLYDSTSACAADDLDSDARGPSLCDSKRDNERGIARALKRVWASLWNYRAFEEREFFSVPQNRAAMAILATKAFTDERANGVALTGNPTQTNERRFVVVAQIGEESVVTPEPGTTTERSLLRIENGAVEEIVRARSSSLAEPGAHVLSDDELRELGALLAHIDENLPLALGAFDRRDVLLEVEFKVTQTGELAVKQVRPFLLPTPPIPRPTFTLTAAPDAEMCALFGTGRGSRRDFELKSIVRFRVGEFLLPSDENAFEIDLIEAVQFGPRQEVATPTSPGLADVVIVAGSGDRQATVRFDFHQSFTLNSGAVLDLELSGLQFDLGGSSALEALSLNEAIRSGQVRLNASLTEGESFEQIQYTSCSLAGLPLWRIEVETEDHGAFSLLERFQPEPHKDVGIAALESATLRWPNAERNVTLYQDLVYSAFRHNQRISYWIHLPAHVDLPAAQGIAIVEIIAPEPREAIEPQVTYLDENFLRIGGAVVSSYSRGLDTSMPETKFKRGDVDGDGEISVEDVMTTLSYLFRSAPPPLCAKAIDANDDGRINVTDAVRMLLHLFAGHAGLPPPSLSCGPDPTTDDLDCTGDSFCP